VTRKVKVSECPGNIQGMISKKDGDSAAGEMQTSTQQDAMHDKRETQKKQV